MWYVIQVIIACSIAYYWTIMDGNTPKDFGHGLFLGGIVAWYITVSSYAVRDWFIKRKDKSH